MTIGANNNKLPEFLFTFSSNLGRLFNLLQLALDEPLFKVVILISRCMIFIGHMRHTKIAEQ